MISIYIQIANFNLKIAFQENIHPIYKGTIIHSVRKWLKPFIINPKNHLKTDAQIIFAKHKPWEIIKTSQSGSKQSFITYYEEKNNRYNINYYESEFQFLFLLKRIMQEIMYQNGNGFFMHSSSCIYKKKLYLFVARPGGGKSTILKLFSRFGAIPLADDYGIIIKENNKFYFYQTPFIETHQIKTKSNKKYYVENIFFLKKSKSFNLIKIGDKIHLFKRISKQILIRDQLSGVQTQTLFDFVSKLNFSYLSFSRNKKKFKNFIENNI